MAAEDGGEHAELHRWLAAHWDPDATLRSWWAALAGTGWAAPSWPVGSFGRGLSLAEGAEVGNDIVAFGAVPGPGGFGVGLVGPTLFDHGDDAQRERHLPGIAAGALAWCQLFSEPGAGSDLAGLQTRSVRDGDTWVVNGQKVWTSGGQYADWAMLLARTDVDVPKHAGISYFLIDMRQPGVEVRPLREMTGRAFFNEVFLTDARVRAADLVGGEGNGWAVANTTLAYERALSGAHGAASAARPGTLAGDLDRRAGDFVGGPAGDEEGSSRSASQRLVALARTRSCSDDPLIRQGLTQLYVLERIIDLTAQRVQAAATAGREVPGTPNLAKMAQNRALRVQRDLTFRILGLAGTRFDYGGARAGDGAGAPGASGDLAGDAHELVEAALFAQGPQIYGGSEQIQRNIVGERVLGLAREPNQDRSTPFRDLPRNV
jgi:alkylation response protein AidB-like acyl-CoA dehydrogenase